MTTATNTKRPVLTGLKLSLGLLSMSGSVLTVKRTNSGKAAETKMVCPLHPDQPHGVKQRYACELAPTGATFWPADCLKGIPGADGKLAVVQADAVKEARISELPERTLDLTSHPYDATTTFPQGLAYVFNPDGQQQFYNILLQLVDEQGVVQTESGPRMLVGLVTFRKGSESFVRVERWGSQLVLRELVRPEEVDEFVTLEGSVDTKNLDMARQLIDAYAEDFDAEAYKSRVGERIAELAGTEGEAPAPKVKLEPKVQDISALLEQSLLAAKAAKGG